MEETSEAGPQHLVCGNEGMVGMGAFMGSGNTNSGTVMAQHTALVSRGGHGHRMGAQSIAHQAKRSGQEMHHLLNHMRTLLLHMSRTSVCNRHHSLGQQLARWLLVPLDRQADGQLRITQEHIASMLGVRREGVTGGALRLQKAGVIRYGRGHMTLLDRAPFEALSCECHSVIREAHPRTPLLVSFLPFRLKLTQAVFFGSVVASIHLRKD